MSFFKVSNIAINGISAVVPEKRMNNDDYDYISDVEKKFLIKTTGLQEKRHADKGKQPKN